jgi:hypothetical protein
MRRKNFEMPATGMQNEESNKQNALLFNTKNNYFFNKCVIFSIFVLMLTFVLTMYYNNLKRQMISKEWNTSEERRFRKEEFVKNITAIAVDNIVDDTKSNEVLILYAYFETPDSRLNIVHFFSQALHASADFIFIINGDSDVDQLLPSKIPNIRVIRRNNSCYDLGSHGEVLKSNDYELVKKYRRFILLNGSVRGPFLPTYVDICWTDLFLRKITDEVKLVGTTYNYWAKHVQSMVIATDKIGIKILLEGNATDTSFESDPQFVEVYEGNPNSLVGLSACPTSKFRAVSAEISLTNLIRRAGYKVAVLMTSATSVQVQGLHGNDFDDSMNLSTNSHNLASVHPYEIIFIKARKGWSDSVDMGMLERLTNFHDNLNYSSWRICKSM